MGRFLHRCASYVMRGRRQAILLGLLFSLLPLVGCLSNVIIALVTLRKGAKEGAIVLLWVILPMVVIATLANPWILLYNIFAGSLFVFLLAIILRQTRSWHSVLEVTMLCGLLVVLIVHLVRPDIDAIWLSQLEHYYELLKNKLSFSVDANQLQLFSKFSTGFQVGLLSIGTLVNLILARGLQSMLYNPGGLRPELEAVHLNKWDVLVLLVTAIAALQKIAIAQDGLPVVLLTFFLAGLSLLHAVINLRYLKSRFFKGWFLIFYGLLIIFFPYVAVLLVLFALMDSYLDFRRRFLPKR